MRLRRRSRRHRWQGHFFENRYKSIVVEEEPYLLEVTRYIHLNPLRAGVVRELSALDRYRWTGHSGLLGKRSQPWQTVDPILGRFGRRVGEARQRYRQFVAEGIAQGRRPDLIGGGLRRSAGGWEGLATLRRGRAQLTSVLAVTEPELTSGSRRRPVVAARAAMGAVAVHGLGLPVTRVAAALGVTAMPFLRGLPRGQKLLQDRGLSLETLARAATK